MDSLCIYFSIQLASMSPKHSHSMLVGYHPGSEARGSLGSVSIVIISYVTLSASFTRLIPCSNNPFWSYASVSKLESITTSIAFSVFLPTTRSRSIPLFSHHLLVTLSPVSRSTARHSSSIGQVAIYWVVVFWRLRIYFSISSNSTAVIAASRGRYSHRPAVSRFGCITVRRRATLW